MLPLTTISLSTVFLRQTWAALGNVRKSTIPCKLPMGKLVSVLKRVAVRGCIACTLYVMYVGVDNLQKIVIPYELPMGKLVGVVKCVDDRECIVCT